MTSPPKSVVWIASYPKSGNTWLRFLIAHLVFGPVISAADLNGLIPDLHELGPLAEPPGDRVLMKTHFPFSAALPLAAATAAAVYVVRDPADVMLSNYHYSKRAGRPEAQGDGFDRYVEDFIAMRGDPRWLDLGMGTWPGNVVSWIGARKEFPVLLLRYEDVLADATAAARLLCRFLGLERSAHEIADAVAGSSFDRMREIERRDIETRRLGIFYKPYLEAPIGAGLRFMRAGRAGDAAAALSSRQRQRFDAAFQDLRLKLGYQ